MIPDDKDFSGLFRYFESLLPKGQHLLLTEEKRKLSFRVWFGYDFLMGEVFFIPIQILDKTGGVFRDILLLFFQLFQQTHHFPKKKDLYDYEMIVDSYLEEWRGQDIDPEARDFLAAYQKGYIDNTFSLVYQKPGHSIAGLEGMIKGYMPKSKREKKLIASIRQGINILRMNKNIFSYVRRPAGSDDNFYGVDDDDYIIEAERLLRFVYSATIMFPKAFSNISVWRARTMPTTISRVIPLSFHRIRTGCSNRISSSASLHGLLNL